MSELILREMTKKEESRLYTRFVMCEKATRFLLLEAFEGKAHKSLNMGSFEEYCKERLGLSHDHSYLSRLISAARVERQLAGEMFNQLNILDGEKPKLSFKTAAEIAKLPEEKWERIYAEYCSRDVHGNRTPNDLYTELKRIVKREMNADVPAIEPPRPVAPVEAVRVKPNLTPIVPPVYDRGPEFDDEDIEEHGRPEEDLQEAPEAETFAEDVPAPEPVAVPPVAPPAVAPPAPKKTADAPTDDALCIAISLLRQYVTVYRSADKNAADELFRDVVKFLKEQATL